MSDGPEVPVVCIYHVPKPGVTCPPSECHICTAYEALDELEEKYEVLRRSARAAATELLRYMDAMKARSPYSKQREKLVKAKYRALCRALHIKPEPI